MTIRTPHVVKDDKHWMDPPEWWKKFKPLRWLAILTIVAGVGSTFWGVKEIVLAVKDHPETERYQAMEAAPVLLAGQFNSYTSVSMASDQVAKAGGTPAIVNNHRPPSEKYPPRNLDTLTAEKFSLEGDVGTLTLEFFNDRLFEVRFEPEDAEGYAQTLDRNGIKREKQGRVDRTDGSLRIATNVYVAISDVGRANGMKASVQWQDLRLVQQLEEWEKTFGAIPVPRRKD